MKFRIDDNLRLIAEAKGEAPEKTATELCKACVDAGVIMDYEGNYGYDLQTVSEEEPVQLVGSVLCEYMGFEQIPSRLFDAYCALIVMGEGDCPVCGGELDYVGCEGWRETSSGHDTPPDGEADFYIYKCRNCGEKTYTEKSL